MQKVIRILKDKIKSKTVDSKARNQAIFQTYFAKLS